MRILIAAALAAASISFVPTASVQAESRSAAPLDASAAVAQVRRIIAEKYVLPERRGPLDAVLAEGLASGRYAVSDPQELARLINEDLTRVGRDKHLNFKYNPGQAAMLRQGGRGDDPEENAAYARSVRQAAHGIAELKLLPGNVRYLDYAGFEWIGEESAAAIDDAMRFLGGGEAIIIDLRRNGGGDPAAVQRIISYFLPPGQELVSFYMYGAADGEPWTTLTELGAPRLIGKPLYVLTSPASASAAEEFAGHVGGFSLGHLVGGTTAGAGFRNDLDPVGESFVLSTSVGRAVLASTGNDWEAVGIAPTIASDPRDALTIAQADALKSLAARAEGPERERLASLADSYAAMSQARAPALPLSAYAGSYAGRTVALEIGGLVYRRSGGGSAEELVPLGGNAFTFRNDPRVRIEFEPDGAGGTKALQAGMANGQRQQPLERDGPANS